MKWTKTWKGSVQPRKQRAYIRGALLHVRGDFIASHVSKELRQKIKHRAVRIKVGDKVKVMRGSFRNKLGKIERINVKEQKIYITGIEFTKRDGSKAMYPIHPSNLLIQELEGTDKRRFKDVTK